MYSERSLIQSLGDLALWAGLYAVGVLLLLGWLVGRTPDFAPCVFVFLCAQGGYLLDRVKFRRSLLDPADAAAQPERFRWLTRRGARLRIFIALELIAAASAGATVSPWLVPLPLCVGLGVWLYAGRPAGMDRPRPKDWPVAKGVLVAVAHTALAVATLVAGAPGLLDDPGHLGEGGLILLLVVFADAVLCDLDDIEADRAFGTRSVPVEVGAARAWAVAGAAYAAAAFTAVLLRPVLDALTLAGLLGVSTAVAAWLRKRRDYVDARLVLIATACLLL